MSKPKLANDHPVMRTIQLIEWFALLLITVCVVIAVYQEILVMVEARKVFLHDILLLFIYLEVLAMVSLYLTSGKLPVRYPIYIAIVAIARYIILDLKELEALDVIWFSAAMLVLTIAALALRYGHAKFPYHEKID